VFLGKIISPHAKHTEKYVVWHGSDFHETPPSISRDGSLSPASLVNSPRESPTSAKALDDERSESELDGPWESRRLDAQELLEAGGVDGHVCEGGGADGRRDRGEGREEGESVRMRDLEMRAAEDDDEEDEDETGRTQLSAARRAEENQAG